MTDAIRFGLVGALQRSATALRLRVRSGQGSAASPTGADAGSRAAEQEAALRVRLQTIVASMTDGLVATDPAGRVTSANARALALLRQVETAVVGHELAEVVDVRSMSGAPLLGDARRVDTEAVLHRVDGSELPVRVAVAPLEDGAGRVVLLADHTHQRDVERMKTEFLANVSHELRTPLTPIRGYAELLVRNPHLSSARAQQFLGEIVSATSRMSRAVDLLVDVAALEAGRVVPVRLTVPVASVVDERMTEWKARYPDRIEDLHRQVAAGLPDLDVDPHWLHKALDELMDNAVKYSAAGSAITVDVTACDDERVRLAVRDEGRGVDSVRLTELLGDFSQADGSETRSDGGMGLGLGFVSRVAERLDLRVQVSSRPGRGSEFALEVPTIRPDHE
jgi:two-component system phosphate regulon sensor histidine kinase PhoR